MAKRFMGLQLITDSRCHLSGTTVVQCQRSDWCDDADLMQEVFPDKFYT